MPIADGGIDVPAREWCSITEAVLWIEFRQPPIDFRWEGSFEDRIPILGTNEHGEGLYSPTTYLRSLGKLYAHLCVGTVSLRGRPAIGLAIVSKGQFGRSINCQEWGDVQLIEAEKIKIAGEDEFTEASTSDIFTNTIYIDGHSKLEWVYNRLCVNFAELKERFLPKNGEDIRIGGDIKTVEPMAFASKKPVVKSNNVLRRALRSKKSVSSGQKPVIEKLFNMNGGMRTKEAAAYLGISKSTLDKYRSSGKGPPYKKSGRICLYFKENLDDWLNSKNIKSTSEKK